MSFASLFSSIVFLLVVMAPFDLRADQNVQYTTRAYTPSKTSTAKTYDAKTYQSSKSESAQRSYETAKPYATDYQQRQKNVDNHSFESQKDPVVSKSAKHELYAPQEDQQTKVKTISSNPAIVTDEKPFESQTGALESKVYKASEKKSGSNPLLRPKQGIKEQGEKQQ